MHFGKVLLLSLCLFVVGIVVDETVRWTNMLHGFFNGVFHAMIYACVWCFTALPWALVIFGLYRWRKWGRFRIHWALIPSVLLLVAHLTDLVIYPPTAQRRFRAFAKTELPAGIKDLQCSFSGGGIADYGDQYYFKCSADDVSRLIREMRLEPDQSYAGPSSSSIISGFSDRPNPKTWIGARQYKRSIDSWSYYLLTNKDQTEVYIFIFCI